jgi:hypothetical protein
LTFVKDYYFNTKSTNPTFTTIVCSFGLILINYKIMRVFGDYRRIFILKDLGFCCICILLSVNFGNIEKCRDKVSNFGILELGRINEEFLGFLYNF